MTQVRFRDVTFAYASDRRQSTGAAALADVDLGIEPGELVLVAGPSGCGKSTLLRCVNGLVPHSTGGRFRGEVLVGGKSTREHPPRDLAGTVGFVGQDPEAHFVVDNVEADIAFVLENLGTEPVRMRRRVEEVLDALDVTHLRDLSPARLSGGEQQRCALAAAFASGPAVLVLDEPTSQLDPQGAEDVLGALGRLNEVFGTTVVLSEHRLDRASPLADAVLLLEAGRVVSSGPPARVLPEYEGAPAVTRLGRMLGWDPPPLTVKAALRFARGEGDRVPALPKPPAEPPPPGPPVLHARGVGVRLGGGREVVQRVDLDLHEGEIVALLGRNGSGKTTLLRGLAGLVEPSAGRVETQRRVLYVPQNPNTLLSAHTVRAELEATLRLLGRSDPPAVEAWLAALDLDAIADRHPRTLSVGQRQRVAVAAVAVGATAAGPAAILLLDEPTRGMDAPSRRALVRAVRDHAAAGGTVVCATHDVELAANMAHRVVVLGQGEVVADGPAESTLAGSLFAPQVLRVLPPFLTPEQVETSLGARS
ncbi:MAG: ATP-binding cassette domain-containing protein [Acidimicrobiia bacterium]|nr:ATP-binding cassette domain-containing protein [Acidimicrobiia bacterium]